MAPRRRLTEEEVQKVRGYFDRRAPWLSDGESEKISGSWLTTARPLASWRQLQSAFYFELALATGLRVNEMTSILWAQILDFEKLIPRAVITVAKRNMKGKKKARTVSLNRWATNLVLPLYRAWPNLFPEVGPVKPTDVVFGTQHTVDFTAKRLLPEVPYARMDNNTIRKRFKRIFRAVGLEHSLLSMHSFRKVFATRVYVASGKDPIETARITGHDNPANLMHYIAGDTEARQKIMDTLADL